MSATSLFARVRVPFLVTVGFPLEEEVILLDKNDERYFVSSGVANIKRKEGYFLFSGANISTEDDFSITLSNEEELRILVEDAVRDNETEILAFLQRNNVQGFISIEEVKKWIFESLVGFFKNSFLYTTLSVKKSVSTSSDRRLLKTKIYETVDDIVTNSTFYERDQTEYFYEDLRDVLKTLEENNLEESIKNINDMIKNLSKFIKHLVKENGAIEEGYVEIDNKDLARATREAVRDILEYMTVDHSDYHSGVYESINKVFLRAIGLEEDYVKGNTPESVIGFNKDFKEIKLPSGEVAKVRGFAFMVTRGISGMGAAPGIVVGLDFHVLDPEGRALSGGGTKAINNDDRVVSSNLFSGIGFLFGVNVDLDYDEIGYDDIYPDVVSYERPSLEIQKELESEFNVETTKKIEWSIEITQKMRLEYMVGSIKRELAFFYTRNKVSQYNGFGVDKELERAWGRTYFVVFEDVGKYGERVKNTYKRIFEITHNKPDSLVFSIAFPVKPIDLTIRTLFDKPHNGKPELESIADPYDYDLSSKVPEVPNVLVLNGGPRYLTGDYWDLEFSKEDSDRTEFIEKSLDYLILDLLKSPLTRHDELIKNIKLLRVPLEREYPYIKALTENLCFKSTEGERSSVVTTDEENKKMILDQEKTMWNRSGEVSEKFSIYGNSLGIDFKIFGTLFDYVSWRGGNAIVYGINLEVEKH